MRHPIGLGSALISLTLALAACGGSSAATPGTPVTTPGPGATAGAPAASAGAAGAPTKAPAGAGKAADACSLITVAEVAAAMTAAKITTMPATSEPSADGSDCDYFTATHESLVGTSYTTDNADIYYPNGNFSGEPALVQVSGLGDKAEYRPASGHLFVRKGGAVLDLAVAMLTKEISLLTQEQRIALEKQLAAAAVARM